MYKCIWFFFVLPMKCARNYISKSTPKYNFIATRKLSNTAFNNEIVKEVPLVILFITFPLLGFVEQFAGEFSTLGQQTCFWIIYYLFNYLFYKEKNEIKYISKRNGQCYDFWKTWSAKALPIPE